MPTEAEFTSEAIETSIDAARHHVSSGRTKAGNPQLYHNTDDRRYDANLDLDALQKRSAEDAFTSREWNGLDPLLRPLTFHLLQRKGITGADAEDVYNETFAELARLRASDQRAPIESIQLFEEIVPLFSKMIQFRAIDWMRRRGANKNQPNTQSSIEELTEREDHAMQFEEEGSSPYSMADELSFDEIYRQCEEALTTFEWELVFSIHVAQSDTMGEILEKPHILNELGLKPRDSTSKKRRILNEQLEAALKKLAICLQN
jgi:DNA-directed RNA polymerase specialized sigma24 family protein